MCLTNDAFKLKQTQNLKRGTTISGLNATIFCSEKDSSKKKILISLKRI